MGKKSIRRIELFFRFFYHLSALAIVGIAIFAVAFLFNDEAAQDFGIIPIGFTIDKTVAQFNYDGIESSVRVDDAYGTLEIIPAPLTMVYIALFVTAVMILVIGFTIRQILLIIKSLKDKQVFTFENIKRIKKIALIMIAFYAFNLVVDISIYLYLSEYITSEYLELNIFGNYMLDPSYLSFPLLLLVISEIFRHGLKLQQEQDLTV